MKNKVYKKSKKICRRKIRIRLTDPNVPSSYVCEILDSSLETESESDSESATASNNYLNFKDIKKSEDKTAKPKNYFEILMSKESRQIFNINSNTRENEKQEENKFVKISKNNDKFKKKKLINQKCEKLLTELMHVEKKMKCEYDSSDDETLFQVKRKCLIVNSISGLKNGCKLTKTATIQNTQQEPKILDKISTDLKSSKVNLSSDKKCLNILSYFSKTGASLKNRIHKISPRKLALINEDQNVKIHVAPVVENSLGDKTFYNDINKENVKLAPLFEKKEKKIIDSARQKTHLNFLLHKPSIPKSQDKCETANILNFPICLHIQQRNEDISWSLRKIPIPLLKNSDSEEYIWEYNKKFSINLNNESNSIVNPSECKKSEVNQSLQCKYSNLNSVINGLKDKNELYIKYTKELEKKNKNNEISFEDLNVLWTEKYKPQSNEILGNETTVAKLRKWLDSWKVFDEELQSLLKPKNKNLKAKIESDDDDDDGGDDDFLLTDEANYGLKPPGNVCIISGPSGCGKTALVFALASELDFNVLEVNASSKRTGKKVLANLQEATQSHKVQQVNFFQSEDPLTKTKRIKNKKKKNFQKNVSPVKVLEKTNSSKISLILIEEAEIIFEEHDEGFFSAIAFLVQTSKRPLIFLTNDPDYSYLDAFKTDNALVLKMEHPNSNTSCTVLEAISSLEGGCVNGRIIKSILSQNSFNLKKSLLQLQFWLYSDYKNFSSSQLFDLGRFWWSSTKFLFYQDMKLSIYLKGKNRKRKKFSFDSSDEEEIKLKKYKLNCDNLASPLFVKVKADEVAPNLLIPSYFKFLDFSSSLDSFRCSNNTEPTPSFQFMPKDSLSLDENMEEVFWFSTNLSAEISNEIASLSTQIFWKKFKEKKNEKSKISFRSPSWEETLWRKYREEASRELTLLVPIQNGRDKRSVYLDYLPAARNICRIENTRFETNTKRKNRFNHYLNNLGVKLTEKNLQINCDVFRH